MRPVLPLAALSLAAALAGPGAAADAAPKAVHVPFVEGRPWSELLARAQREKKPLLVDVYAVWCNPCKWMDRTTFADPKVVEWVAARAIPVRIDAEKGEGRKIAARYAVSSFPTILLVDPKGNEIDRMMGAQPAGEFERLGELILSGKGPLATANAELKQKFNLDTAMQLVTAFTQRNDVERLKPVVLRVISEDPDLTDSRTLAALSVLASLEDLAGALDPETADYLATYLPKMGSEPRRSVFAVLLARDLSRRGDVVALREHVRRVANVLPQDGYVADLYTALGDGEKKAGGLDAALAAYRKALALIEQIQPGSPVAAARHFDVAELLLASRKTAEGRAEIAKGLAVIPGDPGALVRAATLQLGAGQKEEALRNARQAVEATRGEDAGAQAALARALAASGDAKGAQAAWTRAHQIDPDNPEYGRPLGEKPRKS